MVKNKTDKVARPRAFSVEFKEEAVRRMATESPAALARELGVVPKVLYYWQRQIKQGRVMNRLGRPKKDVVAALATTHAEQIAELEQLVGRQQRELAFFRGAWQRVVAWIPASNDAGATRSLPKSGTSATRPRPANQA